MNIDFNTFTEKSAFAVQEAQNLARQHGQQEVNTWHLLLALVQQDGGIVPGLLERLQVSPSAVELAVNRELEALPKASGSVNASQVYVSSALQKEVLHERVVGQDEAVVLVSEAILRARAGIKDPRRPVGSFLFLGPTGVGKTELARTLAQTLFDTEDNIVRIDMTFNVGSRFLTEGVTGSEIPESVRESVMTELRQGFRPEFLNRIDDTVLFKPLTLEEITQIVDLLLADLNKRLANRRITIEFDDAARTWIGEKGYDPVYGARPLKRFLQKQVETKLARALLSGEIAEQSTVIFKIADDALVMEMDKE